MLGVEIKLQRKRALKSLCLLRGTKTSLRIVVVKERF